MRQWSGKKPQNIKKTLRALGNYLGRHKMLLVVVAVLVTISAVANLLGTFMIKPVVNTFIAQDGGSKLIVGVLISSGNLFLRCSVGAGIYSDNGKCRPENNL